MAHTQYHDYTYADAYHDDSMVVHIDNERSVAHCLDFGLSDDAAHGPTVRPLVSSVPIGGPFESGYVKQGGHAASGYSWQRCDAQTQSAHVVGNNNVYLSREGVSSLSDSASIWSPISGTWNNNDVLSPSPSNDHSPSRAGVRAALRVSSVPYVLCQSARKQRAVDAQIHAKKYHHDEISISKDRSKELHTTKYPGNEINMKSYPGIDIIRRHTGSMDESESWRSVHGANVRVMLKCNGMCLWKRALRRLWMEGIGEGAERTCLQLMTERVRSSAAPRILDVLGRRNRRSLKGVCASDED